jgi:ketosteroid isomerase-like protein
MNGAELQEFIDRYNDAWNAHDVDAIVAMHTEDSVFQNHATGDLKLYLEVGNAVQGIFSVFPTNLEAATTHSEDLVVHDGPGGRGADPAEASSRADVQESTAKGWT